MLILSVFSKHAREVSFIIGQMDLNPLPAVISDKSFKYYECHI